MKKLLPVILMLILLPSIASFGILVTNAQEQTNYISFTGTPIAVQYPYVVTDNQTYNLLNGNIIKYPFRISGADFISPATFILYGNNGAFLVENDEITRIITAPVVSAAGYYVLIYTGTTLYVEDIRTVTSYRLPVPSGYTPTQLVLVDGTPVVVFKSLNDTILESAYMQIHVKGVVLVKGDIFVNATTSKLQVYRYTATGKLVLLDTAYLPEPVVNIDGIYGKIVYAATTDGLLVKLDLASHTYGVIGQNIEVLGSNMFYYRSKDETIYGTYTVPGKIYGVLGQESVITYYNNKIILYPLKPVTLVVTKTFIGRLLANYTLQLDLAPGVYTIPCGVLTDNAGITLYLQPYRTYTYPPTPSNKQTYLAPVLNSTLILYSPYTNQYQIPSAYKVFVGYSSAAILTSNAAYVFTHNKLLKIPGIYLLAGFGDNLFTLYDGSIFTIYTSDGKPVYALSAPINTTGVQYVVVEKTTTGYALYLYGNTTTYMITSDSVKEEVSTPVIISNGAVTKLVEYPTITILETPRGTLYIPSTANTYINAYLVTINYNNTAMLLDTVAGVRYTIVNIPASTVIYPLSSKYILAYNEKTRTAYIIPFKLWVNKNGVIIATEPKTAQIYINGKLLGQGYAIYYANPGTKLYIAVRAEHYKPFNTTITVGYGMKTLHVKLEKIVAQLRIYVEPPVQNINITKLVLLINGTKYIVPNNGAINLTNDNYQIKLLRDLPYGICSMVEKTIYLAPGQNRITLTCNPNAPYLLLYSSKKETVNIYYTKPKPKQTPAVTLQLQGYKIVPVRTGTVYLVGLPKEGLPVEKNVTIKGKEIVFVNMTPPPLAHVVVKATVPNAKLNVLYTVTNERETYTGQAVLEKPGRYIVVVSAPGYVQKVVNIDVKPGENKVITVQLVKASTPTHTLPIHPAPTYAGRFYWFIPVILAVVFVVAFMIKRRRKK